jgi:hypothetical protein
MPGHRPAQVADGVLHREQPFGGTIGAPRGTMGE